MKNKTLIWLAVSACLLLGSAAQAQTGRRSYSAHAPSSFSSHGHDSTLGSSAAAVANATSQGGSAMGVGSQGQSVTIDSHANYQAQARNPVSTAVAPPLVSSNDTCMGSTAVAGSAVSVGLSVGTTWTDSNCVMLKNAREIWNMGFKGAALARLCMDDLNKEALESTGIICPERRKPRESQAAQPATAPSASAGNETFRY